MTQRRTLDPATTAVLVVDVQRRWTELSGATLDPPVRDVLPRIGRLIGAARICGAMVILIRQLVAADEHTRNTLEWDESFRTNLLPHGAGVEFDPCIVPHPGDVEIVKQRHSAFIGTSLDELLHERGVSSVVVVGFTTNIGVHSTVRDAWQLDYYTVTVADCCTELADLGAGSHGWALSLSARSFGEVLSSDEVITRWKVATRASTLRDLPLQGSTT